MVRVRVPDAAGAKGLVQRLARVFEPTAVMLDADRSEVRVEERQQSSQTVTQVISTVESWLEETAVDSVTVWIDDNEYTLARRAASIASSQ